jgi:hypothetical protein
MKEKKVISMQYFTRYTYLNELVVTVHEFKKEHKLIKDRIINSRFAKKDPVQHARSINS